MSVLLSYSTSQTTCGTNNEDCQAGVSRTLSLGPCTSKPALSVPGIFLTHHLDVSSARGVRSLPSFGSEAHFPHQTAGHGHLAYGVGTIGILVVDLCTFLFPLGPALVTGSR